MPPSLFRRRLTCFYCGKGVTISNAAALGSHQRISRFKCPHCDAVNHLDSNGQIADFVPEDSPSRSVQFARALTPQPTPSRATSPDPFCRQCQTNQLIIRKALDEYLPDEDDPTYLERAQNLEAYQAQLEKQYPPVCGDCEGLVTNLLHQANYKAKTRGLATFLAKSESQRAVLQKKTDASTRINLFEFAVWLVRGVGWVTTTLAVIVWHLSSVVYSVEDLEDSYEFRESWVTCAVRSFEKSYPDLSCYGIAAGVLKTWLPWTILFFGWNYQAYAKKKHPKATLHGWKGYLAMEAAVFAIRLASWWVLAPGGSGLPAPLSRTVHLALLALSVFILPISLTRLKLVEPPRISLREKENTFQFTPPTSPALQRPTSLSPPANKAQSLPETEWSSFHSALPSIPSRRPITPVAAFPPPRPTAITPPETDEMDWKPTIATPVRRPAYNRASTSASTFAGKPFPSLAPRSTNSILDSPDAESPMRPSRFANIDNDSPIRPSRRGETSMLLQPPRFFPKEEPTGLEDLFESTVRLVDDGEESSILKNPQAPTLAQKLKSVVPKVKVHLPQSPREVPRLAILAPIFLLFAFTANTYPTSNPLALAGRIAPLLLTSAVPLFTLQQNTSQLTPRLLTEILLPLAPVMWYLPSSTRGLADTLARLIFLVLLARESWRVLGHWSRVRTAPATHAAKYSRPGTATTLASSGTTTPLSSPSRHANGTSSFGNGTAGGRGLAPSPTIVGGRTRRGLGQRVQNGGPPPRMPGIAGGFGGLSLGDDSGGNSRQGQRAGRGRNKLATGSFMF